MTVSIPRKVFTAYGGVKGKRFRRHGFPQVIPRSEGSFDLNILIIFNQL